MLGCILTLVAVILYFEFGTLRLLRLFFVLLGVALTAVGVFLTLRLSKNKKEKMTALAVHALLWVFGRFISWILGPFIALGIIWLILNRDKLKRDQQEEGLTLASLPPELYNGNTTYTRKGSYGWGAEYVNQANPSETFTITTIYSASSGQVHTNAGVFWYN